MYYPNSKHESMDKSYWYNKGRESALRENRSGCCCLIEGETIVSPCLLHKLWKEEKEEEIDLTEYNKQIREGLKEDKPFEF